MKKVKLFWSDNAGVPNFGDELNPYLVSRLSNKKLQRVTEIPRFPLIGNMVNIVIGSVICAANYNCNVWGAGIISHADRIKKSNFYAVRGPKTQNKLKELGFMPPDVIGDPALLMPDYYTPRVENGDSIGIIPHYVDLHLFNAQNLKSNLKVIDLTKPVETVIDEICSCKYTVSSSLHGIIVSHAYGIPSVWMKMSNDLYGDDIKFNDYFESIGLIDFPVLSLGEDFMKQVLALKSAQLTLPKVNLGDMRSQLLSVCPFI